MDTNNMFLDSFASVVSHQLTWIAMYIAIALLVIKNNKTMNQILIVFACGIVGMLLSYPFFTYQEAVKFSLAIFFTLLTRSSFISASLFSFALLSAYARLHLGATELSDALFSSLYGTASGAFIYLIYYKITTKLFRKTNYISTKYTSTGYDYNDIYSFTCIVVLTLIYSVIRALIP